MIRSFFVAFLIFITMLTLSKSFAALNNYAVTGLYNTPSAGVLKYGDIELGRNNYVVPWDRRRHNIITFKATLADLAVDGRVPRNLLPSAARLVEDARKELLDWVNRLQSGDVITFEAFTAAGGQTNFDYTFIKNLDGVQTILDSGTTETTFNYTIQSVDVAATVATFLCVVQDSD
jgi:hypothetical protein